MKRCSTCGELKPLDEFNLRRRSPDGRQFRCRACSRAWYLANRERHIANVALRRNRVRAELFGVLMDLLSESCCIDCGEDDPVVLEFDHVGPKTANVSELAFSGVSEARLRAEIAQCEIVCANCHRRRTARRAMSRRWRATRKWAASDSNRKPAH